MAGLACPDAGALEGPRNRGRTRSVTRSRLALNVTNRERDVIRRLFVAGMRIADIARKVKRSESTIGRAVRGMKRPKPRPPSRRAKRDAAIINLRRSGSSFAQIGREFGITASHACEIVRRAAGKRRPRPLRRTALTKLSPVTASRPRLSHAQRVRRDATIARLRREGVSVTKLALRFSVSPWTVRWVVRRRSPARARLLEVAD